MPVPQLSVPHYIFAPNQATPLIPANTSPANTFSYIAFTSPTDPQFVGYINDLSGIDSPEARENAALRPARDGGVHGRFYWGRRPFSIAGFVVPQTPASARNATMAKMQKMLRQGAAGDLVLTWTADGLEQVFLPFRTQQPLRFAGGVNKTFQFGGVTAGDRAYGVSFLNPSVSGATSPLHLSCTNGGNAPADFIATVTGPITAPWYLFNNTSGYSIRFTTNLPALSSLVIDTYTSPYPRVYDQAVGFPAGSHDSWLDATQSYWDSLFIESGVNDMQLIGASGMTSATTLQILWRNAYV